MAIPITLLQSAQHHLNSRALIARATNRLLSKDCASSGEICPSNRLLVLFAHRTPRSPGGECRTPAGFRALTIAAMCRCHLVCPLTILGFGEDFCGFQPCHTACTVPHIAKRTAAPICLLGGLPCRAIH
jgi:hypothetical protein